MNKRNFLSLAMLMAFGFVGMHGSAVAHTSQTAQAASLSALRWKCVAAIDTSSANAAAVRTAISRS